MFHWYKILLSKDKSLHSDTLDDIKQLSRTYRHANSTSNELICVIESTEIHYILGLKGVCGVEPLT